MSTGRLLTLGLGGYSKVGQLLVLGLLDDTAVAAPNSVTAAGAVVGSPTAAIVCEATANSVEAVAATVGTPAVSVVVTATLNSAVASTPIVVAPVATLDIAATPNSVVAISASVGTPASAAFIAATANNVTAASASVGTPATSVTVAATPNSITAAAATVGTPAAVAGGMGVSRAGVSISTTSGASLEIGPITASIGDVLLLCVAADNAGVDGLNSTIGASDTSGNTYTAIAGAYKYRTPVANSGVSNRLYRVYVTSAMVADTVTVTFAPDTEHKVAVIYRVQPSLGHTLHVAAAGSDIGNATTQSDDWTVDAGQIAFAFTAFETDETVTVDSDTTNGTWSDSYGGIADTGGPTDAIQLVSQYKLATGTGTQTFNTSLPNARPFILFRTTVYETESTVAATPNSVICDTPTAGTPAAGVGVQVAASNIEASSPTVGAPTATITTNTTPNDIESGDATVGPVVATIACDATANSIEASSPTVGTPAAAVAVVALPDAVELAAVVGQPSVVLVIDSTVGDVLASAATVGTPTATIVSPAAASTVYAGTPTVGTPAAAVTVIAMPSGVTASYSVGQPAAVLVIGFTSDSVLTSPATVGSPTTTITVPAVASTVYAGTPLIGTPPASMTVTATSNSIEAGVATVGPVVVIIDFPAENVVDRLLLLGQSRRIVPLTGPSATGLTMQGATNWRYAVIGEGAERVGLSGESGKRVDLEGTGGT